MLKYENILGLKVYEIFSKRKLFTLGTKNIFDKFGGIYVTFFSKFQILENIFPMNGI